MVVVRSSSTTAAAELGGGCGGCDRSGSCGGSSGGCTGGGCASVLQLQLLALPADVVHEVVVVLVRVALLQGPAAGNSSNARGYKEQESRWLQQISHV
jgi:hypothetical protein